MRRYFRLYCRFFKQRLMREMEFRTNVLIWTGMGFLWLALAFISIDLIFGQVTSIAGWGRNEVILLVFINALFFDFFWTLVLDGLQQFNSLIRNGELDLLLTKPVNARFYVSFREPEFDHYLRIIFLLFAITRLLKEMGLTVGPGEWAGFGVVFALALIAFYSLIFSLVTTNIWFIRLFNVNDLIESLVYVGRYPLDIFKGKARFFFTWVVPTALVSYFPAQFLLGRGSLKVVFISLLVAIFTFGFSHWFWRFALKRYSSASS